MRAPLSWLRDYAPLEAPVERLTEVLSNLGLVVEGVEEIGRGLESVVVSRVLSIRSHPNADRIRLVDVDAGNGEALQIVCGAWNFAEGDLVPLAPVGAVLPGGFEIGRRKMRGEISNGMLCSASELGLPPAAGSEDGLMILGPGSAAPGTPLRDALGIEADVVFDIDVTPNRPDALSMAGVARDLAAGLGEPWSWPTDPPVPPPSPDLGEAKLTVEAGDLCPRFTATIIEGAPHGASPPWLARRLLLAGMRPISAVVDVSNYVMLDVGQPNHAYDLDRLGGGGILVRRARPGERIVTLDDVERTLGPDDCVICDAEGDPVGVAGVMGGATAEIQPATRRVLLEAAFFEPRAIARTGKRLGLHSEARTRFERGVDPEVADRAIERFVGLLASAPGGESLRRGPSVDLRDERHLPRPPKVRLRTQRVNGLLGTAIDDSTVASLLGSIGFMSDPVEPGVQEVQIPSWRLECSREIDLVEEVARLWGYGRIERTVPGRSGRRGGVLDSRQRERRRIRALLSGFGFDEAWTTTFLAPGDLQRAGLPPEAVEVENPLDRSESLLRTSLRPGLLKALRFNLDRQMEDLAFFEIGRVFALPGPGGSVLPAESELLGLVVLPPREVTAARPETALRSVLQAWRGVAAGIRLEGTKVELTPVGGLHPGRCAVLHGPSGALVGEIGELATEVMEAYGLSGRAAWLGLSLDRLAEEPRRPRLASDVSRYPASEFDLAFLVAEATPAATVAETIRATAGPLAEDVVLFDVYRGKGVEEGHRSLAFRIRLRAPDRTLDDTELADRREALIEAAQRTGARLRS